MVGRVVKRNLAVNSVEQIHKRQKEQQLKQAEAQRQKPSLKHSRKEGLAFDINPGVVLEFLSRQRLEGAEGQVTFQKPSEEYSPWKGTEVEVEKKNTSEARPATFAQAVLVKQEAMNGLSPTASIPKGKSPL